LIPACDHPMSAHTDSPRLLIDDNEVDLASVWIHAQDDPYPGGHRYCLWLPGPLGNEWMSKIGLDPAATHKGMERLSRDGLFWLDGVIKIWRMTNAALSNAPLLFVINTISQIAPLQEDIEVRGVCSPFLLGSSAANPL